MLRHFKETDYNPSILAGFFAYLALTTIPDFLDPQIYETADQTRVITTLNEVHQVRENIYELRMDNNGDGQIDQTIRVKIQHLSKNLEELLVEN